MSTDSKFWNDCYAEGKTGWDRGEVHPFLMHLLENEILRPCSIVVPGCGQGYEFIELAKRGFSVTGIDLADEPVHHLRARLEQLDSKSEVLQTDFFEFKLGELVDAIYEQTCLCAISPQLREKYEQTVFNSLKPSGKLYALFVQKAVHPNDGPPFHCELDEMRQLFPTARWKWPDREQPLKFEHPSGTIFELAFVLTKNSGGLPTALTGPTKKQNRNRGSSQNSQLIEAKTNSRRSKSV